MKDTELNVNQEQLNNLKQQVSGVEPAGGANDKKSEIQADLSKAQLDLNAQVEQANKEIQAEKEADKEKNDVQAEAGLDQKQPVKAAPIEDPAQRMQALENYLVQTQAQIKELSEQNKKLSQILLASMEEKKKQEKEKEAKEEATKEQKNEKKEPEKKKKPRLDSIQIEELLEERVARHIKRAEDAAKGKYNGKVMPNGMQPKYYFAAVRDFHKDMQEKIGKINDPKKREQYFAQYYNQNRMAAYVKHRATDPVYQRMVDKLKADKVLETYQKARYERSPKGIKNMRPFGRGYSADGEISKIHAIDTDRKLFQSDNNQNPEWLAFKNAVKEYNEKVDKLTKEGKAGGDEAREALKALDQKRGEYIGKWGEDKGQDQYVREAIAMTRYTKEAYEKGIVYANVRHDCRCVIDDAAKDKKAKLDYADPLAAADLIIAKKMMSDNVSANRFWDSLQPDPKIKPDEQTWNRLGQSAVKNFQKARTDMITSPFYNMSLLDKHGKALNDFPTEYDKVATKQIEKIKKAQLQSEKQKQKELQKLLKKQEKERKAAEKKKQKEEKNKEKEIQKTQTKKNPKPAVNA